MKEFYPVGHLSNKQKEVKEACENRFYTFCKVVDPTRHFGHIHEEVCDWIQTNYERDESRQLVLLPRGHLKSTIIALYAAWRVVKKPWITILYASASGDLAEKQLYSITNILTGPDVSHYWRGLIRQKKTERDKWRTKSINVDHPSRKQKHVRDDTIRAMSVGATIAGDHYDLCILDDIIAPNSDADPWTVSGREMVSRWYAQLTSVMNPGTSLIAVGTRYHRRDLYAKFMEEYRRIYDKRGDVIERIKQYKTINKVVETNGQFLWPRSQAMDGEWYGFNESILDGIKESYIKVGQAEQFFAQYYQNPTDQENPKINANFIYYEKESLVYHNTRWHIRQGHDLLPLMLFAAMDLAFTVNKDSDYTAIIVEGIDANGYKYIIDIDRFRTRDPYVMLDRLFGLHGKWSFYKCRIETTAGQVMFVPLVQRAMFERNQRFIIDEFKPLIKKEERIMASLSPIYQLQQCFHFRGGYCEELERQLIEQKPEHDDIADVHAAIQEIMFKPAGVKNKKKRQLITHARFGGVQDIIRV